MKKYVYLAGPISGCTDFQANSWREWVAKDLAEHGIVGVSPLRCEPIVGERYGLHYADPMFGTARAIASKNMFDVRNCDMTIAWLPRPGRDGHQSYGTICEIAWARMIDRPTIVVTNDPDVRDHPVINACAGWVLENLEDAVEVAVGVLGGYTGGKNV